MLGPAFAYELIFGANLSDLFPALYEQVGEDVIQRMHALCEGIAASGPTQLSTAKLALLKEAVARLSDSATEEYGPQAL
jgi:hypothetical protein